jgi:hypothetical protein
MRGNPSTNRVGIFWQGWLVGNPSEHHARFWTQWVKRLKNLGFRLSQGYEQVRAVSAL